MNNNKTSSLIDKRKLLNNKFCLITPKLLVRINNFVSGLIEHKLTDYEKKKMTDFVFNCFNDDIMSSKLLTFNEEHNVVFLAMSFYNILINGSHSYNLIDEIDLINSGNDPSKLLGYMSDGTEYDTNDTKEMLISIINKPTGTTFGGKGKSGDDIALHTVKANVTRQRNFNDVKINLASFGNYSLPQIVKLLNPLAAEKTFYVCLDSKYARFLDNNTKMQWDISQVLQFDNDIQAKYTVVKEKIRNIKEMRVHSYIIPKTVFTANYNRSNLFIEELGGRCFSTSGSGDKFHTVGYLSDVENPIPSALRGAVFFDRTVDFPSRYNYEVLSGYRFNEGKIRFDPPVNELSSFTLSIRDPFNIVNFPQFRYEKVKLQNYNLTPPANIGTFDLKFESPHFITNELLKSSVGSTPIALQSLKIINFTTTNPINDALLIEFMNNNEFTYITLVDDTTLQVSARDIIPYAGSRANGILQATPYTISETYALTGTPQSFAVELDGLRTFFTIEFTCEKDSQEIFNLVNDVGNF